MLKRESSQNPYFPSAVETLQILQMRDEYKQQLTTGIIVNIFNVYRVCGLIAFHDKIVGSVDRFREQLRGKSSFNFQVNRFCVLRLEARPV